MEKEIYEIHGRQHEGNEGALKEETEKPALFVGKLSAADARHGSIDYVNTTTLSP